MKVDNYTLTITFNSAYDLRVAIAAIEMVLPGGDGDHNILDSSEASLVALGIANACFWKEKKALKRPPIMPGSFSSDSYDEVNEWKQVAEWFIEAGVNLQQYVKKLEVKANEPS